MRLRCLVLPAILLLSAIPAFAQRSTATIRGTVRDSTQAVMPGATVTATNEETGLVRSLPTNTSGVYSLPELPIGRYRVEAEMAGFKKAARTGVILRVADDFAIDFVLEAGGVAETVSVEASATPVKVLGGDVSGVITGEQVRELPLNGRNFLQLATLMPGVSAPDFLNVKDKGLLGGSDLSVSGSDVTANLWTVDGANNNDVGSNRTIVVYPSLEGIQEFKILRNSYGPEFGGAGGAQINIVTRGGTNRFNGSAFYSGRNDALNAKEYFLKINDQPKADLKRNDFGGSLGGPIIRDKLHFFASTEWNIEDRGTPRVAVVPTQAERNGDFSGTPSCNTNPIPIDPLTGNPFPNNRIPANRISPAGQAFLNLYALPNLASNGCENNWATSVTSPIRYKQFSGRGDWTLSNATRLMVRYTQDSWKNDAPRVPNLWGDDPFPSVDSNWDQPSKSFVASLNQTLGTSATNSLQFSYTANKIEITRGGLDTSLGDAVASRLQPIFGYDAKLYGTLTSHPVFWGGGGYGTLWNEAPFNNNMDLFVIKDDYTRVFGKHFVKAGVLVSVNSKNEDTNGNGSQQHSEFWGQAGLPANSFTGTGNILSDFLLKDMSWGFDEPSASRSAQTRWRDFELYVSDSWQASRKVTFDYGVRYSIFYNPYAADDTITSFVPSLFNPALGNDPCNGLLQVPGSNVCQQAGARGGTDGPNRSLMAHDYNNFAPRLGVAWDVKGDSKTALRAGIGHFFLRERVTPLLSIAANPPFTSTIAGVRTFDSTECFACSSSLGAPIRGVEEEQTTPHNWQWNVTVQHEVFPRSTIEVGYVANYGYDLLRMQVANQVLSGDTNANGVDDRREFVLTAGGAPALRQFGVFGNNNIGIWTHSGESTYNSLQTQWVTRFGRGSQFQTSYTLARSRANLGLTSSGQLSPNNVVLDNQNPDLDWGRPDTARTHIYNASLIWMLPLLENRSKLVQGIFGDWEITTIIVGGSGQAVNVYTGSLSSGLNGGPSGTGFNDNQVPNRVAGEPCKPSGGPDEQIINPNAFTLDGFVLGRPGNAERGDCNGPGYFQTDLAFYKNISLSGRVKLQFRWDIFNFFNNTNFLGPGDGGTGDFNNVMNPSSVTLNSDRTQIATAAIPSSFGKAVRTRDARQMQIGFKLLW
jgi:Carboxypeptidase regulatory-like domain